MTMKKVIKFFRHLLRYWRCRGMFVIVDGRDNSVTFSRRLFNHLHVFSQDEAKVMMFRLANHDKGDLYAFMLNPEMEIPTQLADIQYNQKYKCIGFECLVPTINRILYDYGIETDKAVRLQVVPQMEEHIGRYYYILMKPC